MTKIFWNELPEHVKAGIARGQTQAAKGKLTPHAEVMKKYARYLQINYVLLFQVIFQGLACYPKML